MFLQIYLKVRKVFKPPKLHFFIGKWKNDPNLPVWRRGNTIRFYKSPHERNDFWQGAKLLYSKWTDFGRKEHPILSRIVKPTYELPIWLSFYVFNCDIMYKTKWEEDDYRYEFPAHFTIVFFGLSFSITAEELGNFYWESILCYIHYKGDVKKACDCVGLWTKYSSGERYFGFEAEFLKDNKIKNELISYQNEVLHNSSGV